MEFQEEPEILILSSDSKTVPTPSKTSPQQKIRERKRRARHGFRVFDLDKIGHDRSRAFLPHAAKKSAPYNCPRRILFSSSSDENEEGIQEDKEIKTRVERDGRIAKGNEVDERGELERTRDS